MLSQIVRFTLPSSRTASSLEFLQLRQCAASAGAFAQYFGYTIATKSSALLRERHEICWVIQWPEDSNRSQIMAELDTISAGVSRLLTLRFADDQILELTKALDATVCEFACIRLSDSTPLSNPDLMVSMNKTYTDTYKIKGFVGGHWQYAIDANETHGVTSNQDPCEPIPENMRRLGVYYLGWESIELHEDASSTAEFAEEMTKLMPYFGPGTGAWYALLRKHQ